MNKNVSGSDSVVNEDYKGPSVTTAIAGEGYIAHFQFAILGLLGGGLASVIFHKPLNRAIAAIRVKAETLRETGAALRASDTVWDKLVGGAHSFTGSFGGWIFGRGEKEFVHIKKTIESAGPLDAHASEALMTLESKEKGIGHWLADHAIPFMSKAKKREMIARDGRWEAAAIGGGLLGSIGFFLSPFFFAHSGYKKGVAGKEQFERAQDEILTVRAERDALRDKYVEAQIELDTVRGRAGDTLTVAKDNPPRMDKPREEAIAALDAAPQLDSPTNPTAPVIGPAPTTGRTLPGEPPRIQEPVIGPDHAPSTLVENAMLADRVAAHTEQPETARS